MAKKIFTSTPFLLTAAFIVAILLKVFIVDIIHIKGNSMNPALNDGDIVVLNKTAYWFKKPSPGDIVAFKKDGKILIKRVYDNIDFLKLYDYNVVETDSTLSAERNTEGEIFVLGDNPSESVDSRQFGSVKSKEILGKIIE